MTFVTFLKCELEPFDIFGITAESKSGEFPKLLNDTHSVFMRSQVGIIPRKIAVVRKNSQIVVFNVTEQPTGLPSVLLYGEPTAISNAVRADVSTNTEFLVAKFVKLGYSFKVFVELLFYFHWLMQ